MIFIDILLHKVTQKKCIRSQKHVPHTKTKHSLQGTRKSKEHFNIMLSCVIAFMLFHAIKRAIQPVNHQSPPQVQRFQLAQKVLEAIVTPTPVMDSQTETARRHADPCDVLWQWGDMMCK